MENKQKDEKLLAIMQFVHHYDPQVSFSSLLNGLSFCRLLDHIPVSQYNFNLSLQQTANKWSDKLRNLQQILFKINQYFEQVHQKCLQTQHIDLIKVTKHQNLEQLIKYFQVVMSLLMESSNKQQFIQSIMNLQESSQQIFVQIIKNSLDPHKFTKFKYQANNFHKLIVQFQQQKLIMQKQIERLCKANFQLLSKVKQYQQTINQIQSDVSSRKSVVDSSIDEGKNVRYLQEYIDKLQQRLVDQSKMYEEEKMNNVQKIHELQQKCNKLQETDELYKIYKQKYDEMRDQMQKMNIWKRQKSKMQKLMEEKDFMVQKLHDRIEQLSQKNLSLQEAQLELKLQMEKKQLKIQKISNQLKKAMENRGLVNTSFTSKIGQGSFLDQSMRECLNNKLSAQQSIFGLDDELSQIKKQNEKLQKKNKQFQKQICKLNKKVERLRLLEQDKNKLEQLVFQLRMAQNEQMNLMFTMFYEGFQQNIETSKKLRNSLLSFKQNEPKMQKHLRKKTGSLLSQQK